MNYDVALSFLVDGVCDNVEEAGVDGLNNLKFFAEHGFLCLLRSSWHENVFFLANVTFIILASKMRFLMPYHC